MSQVQRVLVRLGFKRSISGQARLLRRVLRYLWDRFLLYASAGKLKGYQEINKCPSTFLESMDSVISSRNFSDVFDGASDLVALKISLLGDCDIGKTSFMVSMYCF